MAKNIYGPAIQHFRILRNLTVEDIARKMNRAGFNYKPAHITYIEEQAVRLFDLELLCIMKILQVDILDLEAYIESLN